MSHSVNFNETNCIMTVSTMDVNDRVQIKIISEQHLTSAKNVINNLTGGIKVANISIHAFEAEDVTNAILALECLRDRMLGNSHVDRGQF